MSVPAAAQVAQQYGSELVIQPLRPGDAAKAGLLLSQSHFDYPAFRHIFPDRRVRTRVLRALMGAAARDAARAGAPLAAWEDGRLVGVALWMPPSTFPLGLGRKLRMAPAMLWAWLAAPGHFAKLGRVAARLEKAGGHGWYLQALGVHPDSQGRGIGKRLVETVLEEAARRGEPVHLHTSDPANIDYYRRFGFEVAGAPVEIEPGGPSYFAMVLRREEDPGN